MLNHEKKYFAATGENSGHLDADSSPFAISSNAWINASNVRAGTTDKGVTAVIESIGGTLRISDPSPSVSFIEIGNTADIVGNRIIYAYYNLNTSQHKIEVYDKTVGVIYLALLSSQVTDGLTFNKDYPIDGRVINGIWYFNDNYNPPRKLNIDAAIKMNNPSYSTNEAAYTNPLEPDVITLIRRPPFYALTTNKLTLGTVTVNNIADFAGQFAWRYTFRDNEISVLSPISKLVNYNTVTETYDAIAVVATDVTGTPQHISQDVQTVDFCVRYAGSPQFFIIKTWDKRIASEAAEIAAHNAGNPLDYTFLNDRIGIALDSAYSVKPYDSVPRLSKTIETGLNRLFLGNNYESFDTPVLSSLTVSLVSDTNHTPFQNPVFKSGGTYQVGIIFRDYYKRVIGNVFTNDTMRFQVPERDYNLTTYYKVANIALSNANAVNEIPDTAYYYEIVITKCLMTRFFLEAKSGGMKYAIKDPVTNVISYQDTYISSAYGLAFNASLLNAEGMGYSFQDGDILKVIQASSSTRYSLAVIGVQDGYIISKLQDLGSFATQPDIIYEIYTPYKESTSEAYWTTGNTLTVTNPTQSGRLYGTLADTIYGDVYLFNRFAPSGAYVAENMSPIPKYWQEWNTNSGEANFVINSEDVTKYTAVRWSNVIIEGSQTNGLSTFDALDEKILPMDLGNLSKLQQTSKVEEQGNIMLAIGEKETASCYLGEVQLVGAAQNAFVATAPNVIGTVNVLKGSFGTINPESVIEYRGNVYWLDMNNGRVIQYSANGLFPISNYKMTRFWKLWCEQFLSMTSAQIEAFGGRPFVFSTVDPFHDELLFSIPKLASTSPKGTIVDYSIVHGGQYQTILYPFDILDFQDKVIVYDLISNTWRGSYSFYTEGFSTLQNQLYSFKDGQFYIHNQYNNQCKFYGIQYTAKIMPVSNQNPSIPKSYNAVAVESNICPIQILFYNEYPYIQQSDLANQGGCNDFANLEGIWNATLYRNILQPTATGYNANGRLTGEKMRNTNMFIMLEFAPTASNCLNLKFLNLQYSISLGNVNV
ncbi:MAG: hypothetical protein V4547_16935 [Bacteroidota bacterium]